jgi:hypothetical protein
LAGIGVHALRYHLLNSKAHELRSEANRLSDIANNSDLNKAWTDEAREAAKLAREHSRQQREYARMHAKGNPDAAILHLNSSGHFGEAAEKYKEGDPTAEDSFNQGLDAKKAAEDAGGGFSATDKIKAGASLGGYIAMLTAPLWLGSAIRGLKALRMRTSGWRSVGTLRHHTLHQTLTQVLMLSRSPLSITMRWLICTSRMET